MPNRFKVNNLALIFLAIGSWASFFGVFISISLLGVGIALTLISGILFGLTTWDGKWLTQHPLFTPTLILVGAMVFSIIAAEPYPRTGPVENVATLFCLFCFSLFFSNFSKVGRQLPHVCLVLAWFLGFLSIAQSLGLFQIYFPTLSRYLFRLPNSELFFLSVGFTRHHTTFGSSLLWLFHILFAASSFSKNPKDKMLFASGASSCVLGILFTFSRGTWLSLLVSAFFVLVLINWRKALLWMLVCLGSVFVMFFSNTSFEHRLRSFRLDANQERFELWAICLRMFLAKPWLGQGYHSFSSRFEQFTDLHLRTPEVPRDPHNMYLDFLATAGTIGFLAFFYFLIAVSRFLFSQWKKISFSDPRKPWLMATLGGWVGFCVGGLFDRHFYMQLTLIPTLFTLGLTTSMANTPENTTY